MHLKEQATHDPSNRVPCVQKVTDLLAARACLTCVPYSSRLTPSLLRLLQSMLFRHWTSSSVVSMASRSALVSSLPRSRCAISTYVRACLSNLRAVSLWSMIVAMSLRAKSRISGSSQPATNAYADLVDCSVGSLIGRLPPIVAIIQQDARHGLSSQPSVMLRNRGE